MFYHLISSFEVTINLFFGANKKSLFKVAFKINIRIFIPEINKKELVTTLHSGHFVAVSMKCLPRRFCPAIDRAITALLHSILSIWRRKIYLHFTFL